MNELDSFTVNFITNGLDKLQDGIKDLRTQMDSLDEAFTKGTSKGDTFFSHFGKWAAGLGTLLAGFLSIQKVINDTFKISDRIINLNLVADSVGRTAQEVETLSRALRPFAKDTNADLTSEAGGIFGAINKIRTDAWRLQFGDTLIEELNRAGGIMFSGNESDQEMLSKIIRGLEYHTQRQDWDARKRLANVLGLSETATAFLSSGESVVDALLKKEAQKTFLSGDENLKNAEKLRQARQELSDTWDRIVIQLQPLITDMVNKFAYLIEQLNPVIQMIIGAFGWIFEHFGWLMEKSKDVGKWLGENIAAPVLEAFHKSSKMSESKFALERLEGLTKAEGLGQYTSLTSIWDDIALTQDMLGKGFVDSAENRHIIEEASIRARQLSNARLIGAGRSPINTDTTVNVGTITINASGEEAGKKTSEAVQKHLHDINPAMTANLAL